eukprot:2319975-Prymnesium_polylepis.1
MPPSQAARAVRRRVAIRVVERADERKIVRRILIYDQLVSQRAENDAVDTDEVGLPKHCSCGLFNKS